MRSLSLFLLSMVASCGTVAVEMDGGLDGDGGLDADNSSPGFSITIRSLSIGVPLDSGDVLQVEIARTGGFIGEISIAAVNPPTGFLGEAIVIPEGGAIGEFLIGAQAPLVLAEEFELTLRGSAPELADATASIDVHVIGTPGRVDPTFGTDGITQVIISGSADDLEHAGAHVTASGQIYTVGHITGGLGARYPFVSRYLGTGAMDPAWNGGVPITTANYCSCSGFAVMPVAVGQQADGKPIWFGYSDIGQTGITADGVALRYGTNGTADIMFGNVATGRSSFDVLSGEDFINDGAVLSTEASVLVGSHNNETLVIRATANGELDTSFANVGFKSVSFLGGNEQARAVLEDSSGRLVVAIDGAGFNSDDIAIVRFLANGTLDSSFGPNQDGSIVIGDSTANESVKRIAELRDGSIVVFGTTDASFQLRRLTSAGVVDSSFGIDGVSTLSLPGTQIPFSMIVTPEERFILAGRSENKDVLMRVRSDGSADLSFGTDGVRELQLGADTQIQGAVSYRPNQLVVFGANVNGNTYSAMLARVWH